MKSIPITVLLGAEISVENSVSFEIYNISVNYELKIKIGGETD